MPPNKPLLLAAIMKAFPSSLTLSVGRRPFTPFGRGGRSV
jgi:hypothetical protein